LRADLEVLRQELDFVKNILDSNQTIHIWNDTWRDVWRNLTVTHQPKENTGNSRKDPGVKKRCRRGWRKVEQ
jgi:hypothetical protein